MAATAQTTARGKPNRASGGRLLDLRAIVAEYGGSMWTWRRLLLAGEIPLVRLPNVRRLFVDRQDLERAIAQWKERA